MISYVISVMCLKWGCKVQQDVRTNVLLKPLKIDVHLLLRNHFDVAMIDSSRGVWINWLNCCEIGSDSHWRDTIDICTHHWRVDLHPCDRNVLTSEDTPASVGRKREWLMIGRRCSFSCLSELVNQQLLMVSTRLLFCLSCLDEKWQEASQSTLIVSLIHFHGIDPSNVNVANQRIFFLSCFSWHQWE